MKHGRVRCECEKPGAVRSGVPGIIAGGPDKQGRRYVERCDLCLRFKTDYDAGSEYARIMGGRCEYNKEEYAVWSPK